MIVSQTNNFEQYFINNVNSKLTNMAKPTQIASRGHPSLRSAKYYCKIDTSIKESKSSNILVDCG